MFKKLISEVRRLGREGASIPVQTDSEGYLDRECPNKSCLYQFKVNKEDWKNKFNDDAVFCPLCRHETNSNSWWTTEQIENAKNQATLYVHGIVGQALQEGARDFNRKQNRRSFISLSFSVEKTQPYHYFIPISAHKEMQLKVKCKECESRYAVIGSAFFCPCCGHNSAEETFDQSIKKIEDKLKNLPIIRKAIEEISIDEATTTCRSLIETSLNEGVVAFQRFCEKKFSDKYPTVKVKFNAFQNLEIGEKYWKNALGESYSDWLPHKEYFRLNILFQRRHLLSHTEGIVDQKYIDRSKDSEYIVGQRLVISENDVYDMLSLIKGITTKIRKE